MGNHSYALWVHLIANLPPRYQVLRFSLGKQDSEKMARLALHQKPKSKINFITVYVNKYSQLIKHHIVKFT